MTRFISVMLRLAAFGFLVGGFITAIQQPMDAAGVLVIFLTLTTTAGFFPTDDKPK